MRRAILFVLTGAIMSGCASDVPQPAALRMAYPYEIVTLDPHGHSDSVTRAVLASVFESLVRFDPGRPVQPWLADRWDNPDHTTWRLHIRDGVVFHDGRALTVDDVVASILRARANTTVGHQLADIEKVEAIPGNGMIEIITSRPSPLLLTRLEAVAVVPHDFTPSEPVGTGPYRWHLGSISGPIVLERWDRYWSVPADFRKATLHMVTATEELLKLLDDQALDVVAKVDVSYVRQHRPEDDWYISASPAVTTTYLALNVERGSLADIRVRRAIDLAIDRSRLVSEVFPEGSARAAYSVVPPEIFGFDPGLGHRDFDLQQARLLIDAARKGEDEVIELVYHEGFASLVGNLVRLIEDSGLRLKPVMLSYDDWYRRLAEAENDVSIFSWTFRVADASPFLDTIVHSRDHVRGLGSFNAAKISDPILDQLILDAAHEPQYVLRLELLQRALLELDGHRAYLPLYQPSTLALARKNLVLEDSSCAIIRPQDVRLRH